MTKAARSRNPRTRAAEVLKEAGVTTKPVPVDAIAQQKGIALRYMPLDESLSGMIFMQNGVPTVVVNSLHHANRRRFTVAHELGHFEFHMAAIGSDVHVDKRFLARDANSSTGFDMKEIEANRFAAELLVPRAMLIEELRGRTVDLEADDELLGELAEAFGVSRQMMAIRVGELLESEFGSRKG
jgi:Zn-dependent peptidase ImmA (M78 family)